MFEENEGVEVGERGRKVERKKCWWWLRYEVQRWWEWWWKHWW